jgi:zinc protease
MKYSVAWMAAVLSCTSWLCLGQHSESSAAAVPKINFEKYSLPNGLQVILHVDHKLPMVHVNQWYDVGSANERLGRTGFAHLFEHMMFQGSKHADKYFPIVETMGANLFEGAINGTTNWDRTNYFATVPSTSLETLLWLESDRLATLPEGINQQKLDNQRDVVKNERRQGLENQPYGRAFKLMCENLYPARHPYANDVIGSHEDLTAASMEDIKEFFRTYYSPNNLSIVIAGDFDPAEVKKLVDKYFGSIPPGPALDRPVKWIPKLDGTRTVATTDRVPQERVYMTWQSPAFFEPGDAEMDLIGLLLTDGLSSRLNKALVYDNPLCSDAVSFQLSRPLGSMFILWATARPGTPLPVVEKSITEEIARLAKDGPGEAELNRAKVKWEYQFVTGLERIGGFGGKADLLNQYNTFLGDPDRFEQDVTRHRNVSVGVCGERRRSGWPLRTCSSCAFIPRSRNGKFSRSWTVQSNRRWALIGRSKCRGFSLPSSTTAWKCSSWSAVICRNCRSCSPHGPAPSATRRTGKAWLISRRTRRGSVLIPAKRLRSMTRPVTSVRRFQVAREPSAPASAWTC